MHLLQQLNAPVTVLQEVHGESFQYSLLRNCLQTRQSMVVRAPARTRTLERQPWSCELSLPLGKMTSSTHFETMHQEAHALTCNKNARQLSVCQHNAVLWPMTMILKPGDLKPQTWPLHCLTIIKSVLQNVHAALQVTKRQTTKSVKSNWHHMLAASWMLESKKSDARSTTQKCQEQLS